MYIQKVGTTGTRTQQNLELDPLVRGTGPRIPIRTKMSKHYNKKMVSKL